MAMLIPAMTKETEPSVMCPAHAPRMKVTARVVDVADVVAAAVVAKKVAHPPVVANRAAVCPREIATVRRSTTISTMTMHETSTRGISIRETLTRAASSRAVAMPTIMTMTPRKSVRAMSTREI